MGCGCGCGCGCCCCCCCPFVFLVVLLFFLLLSFVFLVVVVVVLLLLLLLLLSFCCCWCCCCPFVAVVVVVVVVVSDLNAALYFDIMFQKCQMQVVFHGRNKKGVSKRNTHYICHAFEKMDSDFFRNGIVWIVSWLHVVYPPETNISPEN